MIKKSAEKYLFVFGVSLLLISISMSLVSAGLLDDINNYLKHIFRIEGKPNLGGGLQESPLFGGAAAQTTFPVHRLYNNQTEDHFYTISEAEKDYLINNYGYAWAYEGIGFYAYDSQISGASKVYRLFNNQTDTHFYTISEAEKNNLINNYPNIFMDEGIAFYAYNSSNAEKTAPVHRLYHNVSGGHFYTISESEKNYLISNFSGVWIYEGVAFYAYNSSYATEPAPTENKLISYWKFDGNALDSAGTNNGIVNGSTLTTGISGQAYSFDGVNDYIDCGKNLSIQDKMTISAWVNWNRFYNDGGGHAFISKSYSAKNGIMLYQMTAAPYNKLQFFIRTEGIDKSAGGASQELETNKWHYISMAYNGSMAILYLNGKKALENAADGNINWTNPEMNLLFGSTYTTTGAKFNGTLDEVKIWNYALTADEIKNEYEAIMPPALYDCAKCPDFNGDGTVSNEDQVPFVNCVYYETGCKTEYDLNNDSIYSIIGDVPCFTKFLGNSTENISTCPCVPRCSGKTCGDNGCGGNCGTCSQGQMCNNGNCLLISQCNQDSNCSSLNGMCGKGFCNTTAKLCQINYNSTSSLCRPSVGECDRDEYCTGEDSNCPEDLKKSKNSVCSGGYCKSGDCIACMPNCNAKECGYDGCSGICGVCDYNEVCQSGVCIYKTSPSPNPSPTPTPSRECEPVGIRESGKYCDANYEWKIQKRDSSSCENIFECQSNACLNKACGESKIKPSNSYGIYAVIALIAGLVITIFLIILLLVKGKKSGQLQKN